MVELYEVSLMLGGVTVLQDVTFSAGRGECVRLAAPPKSGRTALLRVMATLWRPTTGTLTVDGVDAVRKPFDARRRLGYVGRETRSFPDVSIDEYLWMMGDAHGGRLHRAAAERVSRAGLALRTPCGALARGEQTVVALCATAVRRPPVLVLDGRSLGVSDAALEAAGEAVRDLRDHGTTIVMAADAEDPLALHCGRVVALAGRGNDRRPARSADALIAPSGEVSCAP